MATKFSTTIQMSAETVAALKSQGYSLYGFKSVEASGSGEPTVWFKLEKDKLLTNTVIHWEEQFQGYNSTSQVSESVTITASNTINADLNDLITIDSAGNLNGSSSGPKGAISFLNKASQQFTVGISQVVENTPNILCAFPILGSGSARSITPITTIALIFSTNIVETATVITRAMSSGALIDLTGAPNNSRTLDFSLDTGWGANGATWLKKFNAFTSMSSLLIKSPSNSVDRAIEKKHSLQEA
ncbi:hypothetical protein HN014_01390 [Aquimarina sp. TRL1]|uniref:hypothetical protein n=1 Tax=Aquimarina sp. (strain TRL1) TaxID=2736252 RepID=UPI00158A0A6C|nr:hypothetical protein [Aquimarina sp. TRL1]QKX03622.1 hypothetical protein HN014_01390 [Aquimarina sp. TRL1]